MDALLRLTRVHKTKMNLHNIAVLSRPPSDSKGSGVRLISHRFPHDVLKIHSEEVRSPLEQASSLLSQLGYRSVAVVTCKRGHLIGVSDLVPLWEALASYEAPPSASWKWRAKFTGSLPCSSSGPVRCVFEVVAHDMAAARVKLAETFDNISGLSWTRGEEVSK